MRLTRFFFATALIAATTATSAWWGSPWGGNNWGNRYDNGYGSGYGGMGGEQYRGGDAAGGGDFSMNLSGRGNTNMRGYGSGYGAGDTWGRSYNYSSPYYGGHAPYGYMSPPPAPRYPARMAMPQSGGETGTRSGYYGYGAGRYDVSQRDEGGVAPSASSAASQLPDGAMQTTVLTTADGMTLYIYAQDSEGVSNCYGQCAANWPPAAVSDSTALDQGMSAIERRDGTKQLALNGKPLYLWVGDQKPGDKTGEGVGGVWSVARR
jgi:predicted lipoprotein with Yx(FWY)xxD motif